MHNQGIKISSWWRRGEREREEKSKEWRRFENARYFLGRASESGLGFAEITESAIAFYYDFYFLFIIGLICNYNKLTTTIFTQCVSHCHSLE